MCEENYGDEMALNWIKIILYSMLFLIQLSNYIDASWEQVGMVALEKA